MGAINGPAVNRSLTVPEPVWPEAGLTLMLSPILALEVYDFSHWGWNSSAILSVLMLALVTIYWFARSLGKRILREDNDRIVAEKVFHGLRVSRVTVPKTEIEKIGVHVIQRRGNKTGVRIKIYRVSGQTGLTINASLNDREAATHFAEQVRRLVEGWSTVEMRVIDSTR